MKTRSAIDEHLEPKAVTMKTLKRKASSAVTLAILAALVAGCASPDHRLIEDQQSCTGMGHAAGTPTFQKCMADLNDRRCASRSVKSGTMHVASTECTRVH
jgi:hypothetical protein